MKRHLPESFFNPVSIAGAVLASASFVTIVFLTLVELLQTDAPAYIGIISYIVLPVPLLIGLFLIPYGMYREKRRIRKGLAKSRMMLTVDLNVPRHRRLLTQFSVVTAILLLFTAYGSYRSFEWTESNTFCGETCHAVMEPEYTAYQYSAHARVKCVDCHVGAGADWYVKSKLSGAYQVYAVAANVYPRPIPTPIANLRPAQETCEQCHWPSHFAGEKKYVNTYFKSDSANTRWTVALLMKIGGGGAGRTPTGGIHWHMNLANEVTYVATDTQRQSIPYIRFKDKATGAETEFLSADGTQTAEEYRAMKSHRMDCIDCHNRPSHIYKPPVRIVDLALALGSISTELPRVRAAGIEVLNRGYSSTQAAMDSIPLLMKKYYDENFPEVSSGKGDLIAQASEELQTQFRRNFFPSMKVSWRAYPNNIGHQTALGCFRCHDGKHVSSTGKVISKDCNSCHTILYQGREPVPTTMNAGGLEFIHPEDIGDSWKDTNCSDCHSHD